MRLKRSLCVGLTVLWFCAGAVPTLDAGSTEARKSTLGRIIVLMVFDGLRPDLVNDREMPNLSALMREGTVFERHHSEFPTLTMVNAAALATGGTPGATGILGDSMYLAPNLELTKANSNPTLRGLVDVPIDLENSRYLSALNGRDGLGGKLLGIEGLAQQVVAGGGFAAIIGKQGPTFLFDGRMSEEPSQASPGNYLFLADDMASPVSITPILAAKPEGKRGDPESVNKRDAWFTDVAIRKALPAAKTASLRGQAALVVLWLHNVDATQHMAGLGTRPALDALGAADANLKRMRAGIAAAGITAQTDVIAVSDHGFATIRMQVSVGDLLVEAGLKQSRNSGDIVVARNGGNDLLYLSPAEFGSEEERRKMLVRIVDFAEAQEWCGAIFSQKAAADAAAKGEEYLGWIPGTFNQRTFGLYAHDRAPDLIISFRELADVSNKGLTGPQNPAFALEGHGQRVVANRSYGLVRPVAGVVYSDADSNYFTTGKGMHGAAGARELHNFAAAAGPDFRRHFEDVLPTGNADIAPTIRHILHGAEPSGATGRILAEALKNEARPNGAVRDSAMTAYLVLQDIEVETILKSTRFDSHDYLDDALIKRQPIGSTPSTP